MNFEIRAHQFQFRAIDSVYFPPGKAGNILRGAFGMLAPEARGMADFRLPSGLAEPPRPFVFRAAHLDGSRFETGETFSLGVNIFDPRGLLVEMFASAFSRLASTGLGPRRGRVELMGTAAEEIVNLSLLSEPPTSSCILLFRTPIELKGNPSHGEMPFGILFARVRDRISTLRSLYQEGPLPIDFQALSARANLVRTVSSGLQRQEIVRRSTRTGLAHSIGGMTGSAEYAGELAEFLPYLRAAWWTGVGRHTVWGNGVIQVV